MENQTVHNTANADVESEEVSESFLCCICLDLLYKPIVLSCGHISCFWCVHRSMSNLRDSHCPICRHKYNHFPNICVTLHLLLSKMYPIAYKIRENQILEEEKKIDCFSPQLDSHASELLVDKEYATESTSKGGSHGNMEQLESVSPILNNGTTTTEESSGRAVAVAEKNFPQKKLNGNCKQISIDDVLCTACKQLLIHPVALNCGHVYCESCIIMPSDQQVRCQVCLSLNPRGFPKVCLELDHFLEEHFSEEYSSRRDAVQLKKVEFKNESTTTCSTKAGKLGAVSSLEHLPWSKVHIGAGCDTCGMFPIIGDRYRCKDCVEAIGFDLCGDCYNTRSKLPGRFNQRHTPEHRLELVKSDSSIRNMMLRLVTGQLEDGSTAFFLADDPENGSPVTLPSDDVQENTSNGLTASVTNADDVIDPNMVDHMMFDTNMVDQIMMIDQNILDQNMTDQNDTESSG